jgi:HAD superfamily hydrolase (TIGR01549 family)
MATDRIPTPGRGASIGAMKAILFDWDGTLADSLGAFYRANLAVMEAFGLPFDEALYRRHYAPDWRVLYRRLGVAEARLDEAAGLWQAQFSVDGARPFPGVRDALVALVGAGYRLGLVTATERAVAEPLLGRFDLDRLVEARVYADDLDVYKPDPAPLRLGLARLDGADPGEAIYVGDVPDDMRMARAVGTGAIGIVSLLGDAEDLVAAGAEDVHPSVASWVARLLADPPDAR